MVYFILRLKNNKYIIVVLIYRSNPAQGVAQRRGFIHSLTTQEFF